jgi:hypothetical protein
MFPPAEVREDALLRDFPGEPLNSGASVLLLARICDRLRAQSVQYPIHPAELRRSYRESQCASSQLGFHSELPMLLFPVVEDMIPRDSGGEIC